MPNFGGTQSILATPNGFEEKVALFLKTLKKIIQENVKINFSRAIKIIAGVNIGTWYNYISNGSRKGKISKYTVDNLSNFFDLPSDVFICKTEFTEEIRNKIIKILKEKFKNIEPIQTIEFSAEEKEMFNKILDYLKNSDDELKINQTILKLKTLINLAIQKLEVVKINKNINKFPNL